MCREPRCIGQHSNGADVHDMALAFGHHARQETHGDAQAAEIIELHGAFEVVKAVVAGLNRAADGAPGIVDQEVYASVVGNQRLHKAVAVSHVGNVGLLSHNVISFDLGFLSCFVKFVLVTAANDGDGASIGKLVRSRQANAR